MSKKGINLIEGVKVLKRPTFSSSLGIFSETYRSAWLKNEFLQDSISISNNKGTIRGMHLQTGRYSQAKLISVLRGSIQDIFIDLRKDSSTFCDYGSLKITEKNNKVLFLPRGFAHGFITLETNTLVSYKMDNHYSPKNEIIIKWDDPDLKIGWPKNLDFTSSTKDLSGLTLEDYLLINKF
jgi:dTDP-4-dehydrorhamnose 3,5-epimerase